jgi:DNA-directed RNA polymerase specialized sigma24 family protein
MQDGEPSAFSEFAHAWYPRIVGWVRTRTSSDKVNDYANEVWIHLTRDGCRNLLKWRGFLVEGEVNPNSLTAFIKTITARRVASLYKVDNKEWLDFGDDEEFIDDDGQLGRNPPDTIEGEHIKVQFRHCFGLLPSRDKRMLIMKWNERSDSDIATLFRMNANNVRQRRYQMVKRLRECLSDRLPGYFSSE